MGIPLIILIYLFSEEKNDVYYVISILIGVFITIFGGWLSIQINKELNNSITYIHIVNFWIPIIIGIPIALNLLVKFFNS